MMQEIIANFHFLRPDWFFALIPAAILFAILKSREIRGSRWEETVDPRLLPFLLDSSNARVSRSPLTLLLVAWILAVIALAGPVWEKIPRPVHEREDALIIALDLSHSMYATDEKPDRLTRAKRKLLDLLDTRDEGVTGLIAWAGDAHTVVPLTDDADTIAAMIPALEPAIMPGIGSRLAPALRLAEQLFHDAGITSGRILVITDEIRDRASALNVARENRVAFPVSVLAVGTPDGAPVPVQPDGRREGYLKDADGVLVIPKVNVAELQSFANAAGGRFSRMTLTDEDLNWLLSEQPLPLGDEFRATERDFDVWQEQGPWLILLLLPLAAFAFRRGWLWSLALLVTMHSEPADALTWDDLWQTRDEQAMEALEAGKADEAAELFENPAWKAAAQYRAENFSAAAERFATLDSADAKYNYGNALAKQGQYEAAIEAYEEALELNPENEDAAFNRQLLEDLLEQQQQQQQDQDQQANQNQEQQQREQEQEGSSRDQQGQDEQQKQQEDSGEQQQAEQEEEENPENRQQQEEGENPQVGQQQMAEEDTEPLDEEERQALEQWLRRVPDDPGGLLRRKFLQQHEDRIRRGEVADNDTKDW